MIDRFRDLGDPRPTRRDPARPRAKARGRLARRPAVEALEGRSLLSTAGSPDFTYAKTAATISTGGPEYDTQGLAVVQFQPRGVTNPFTTVAGDAIQSDGKVVVVGTLNTESLSSFSEAIGLSRLNADGTVDSTFGTNGVVILPAPVGKDTGQAVAIQPNGQIVVAANVVLEAQGAIQHVGLYRLNADGSADTTFGTGGSVTFTFDQGTTALFSSANVLAIQADGKVVVGGYGLTAAGTFLPVLARLDADGTPDATFGTGGQVLPSFADTTPPTSSSAVGAPIVAGLVIRPDGAIDFDTTVVPASGTGTETAVGQLSAAGSFDPTFGAGGQVLLSNSTADTAGALAVQADGRLIVAGGHSSYNSATGALAVSFDVYRLKTDGSADTSFGTMGEANPESYSTSEGVVIAGPVGPPVVASVLIRPDGRIVLGGTGGRNDLEGQEPELVGLNPDGSPDLTFGAGGQDILPVGYSYGAVRGLALQADGKILAAVGSGVARLLAVGSPNDFDEDGTSDPAVILPNFQYPLFAYRPSSGGGDVLTPFGIPGAGQTLPAPGAYDGSGVDELGVYLPAIGAFGIRPYGTTGSQDRVFPIGLKGLGNSIPAPADYTGSGHTEVGVYEPSLGAFVYSTSLINASNDVTVPFGTPGAGNSIPVPADYDGSGRDELGVYLPASASFAYRPADGGPDVFTPFGTPGAGNSIPAPADYDGYGHVELGVYLPAIGAFAYRPYGTDGSKDVIVPFGMPGLGNSIPMPGDYDGSGHTELAVYMPTLGEFAYRPYGTTGSKDVIISFGQPGSGNTVPFDAQGAEYAANGSGGGGGLAHPSSAVSGWVDFVPDPAGMAKKGHGGSTGSAASQGQS